MAEDNQDEDKQFEPTQKKLDDARRKGEIAKSNDLITAAGYAGLLIAALSIGPSLMIGFASAMTTLLSQASELAQISFDGPQQPLMGGVLFETGRSFLLWFLIPMAMAILAVFAQRAFVFAPSKLVPKLSRISPMTGAKNKLGREGLFEFAKSFAKLLLYSGLLGTYLIFEFDRMVATMFLSPAMITVEMARLTVTLLLIVLIIAFALGALDFLWQRAQHLRKNKMSRKELMDELKQSDGDPMLKQQRRQKGIDLATNQMLAEVGSADVVIVNPVHYAVALKWSRLPGSAPKCVAKGVDEIAARIREAAAEHAIPIYSDPPTTRAVYAATEIGEEIDVSFYRPVAAAIRFAEKMRRKKAFS